LYRILKVITFISVFCPEWQPDRMNSRRRALDREIFLYIDMVSSFFAASPQGRRRLNGGKDDTVTAAASEPVSPADGGEGLFCSWKSP